MIDPVVDTGFNAVKTIRETGDMSYQKLDGCNKLPMAWESVCSWNIYHWSIVVRIVLRILEVLIGVG
jgi:hypothetical protein